MDTAKHTLYHVRDKLAGTRRSVRLSDVRATVDYVLREIDRALAPTEPTPLELRTALQALARTPAVRQAMGNNHTSPTCGCALCTADRLTR
jgi:hypothetical protein